MSSLLILIPLIGLIALNLPPRHLMKRFVFWFAIFIFVLQVVLALCYNHPFFSGDFLKLTSSFKVDLAIDHLTLIMLLSMGLVSLATILITRNTIGDPGARFNFINLLIIASIGMTGIVLVRDIFSLYVFMELTAIASFIMIAFQKNLSGLEGSFKYMVLSTVATVLMLSAIAIIFMIAGNTSFSAIHSAILNSPNSFLLKLAMIVFICGLFIKGGLVPFHGWLPDAYSAAPAPASVLLAGIITKASGIYTLMRIVSIFGFTPSIKNILMLVGAISILVGAFAALGQKDFKRLLAYSSISQVGYIILGFGTGTPLGVVGAAFHIFNHSIFKSLLFINSAAVETQTGTTDLNKMGGISTKMPITGTTSIIAFLSTCGIPPLSGFWSKLIIIIALCQAGNYAYATIAVLASVLTLAYLLFLQRSVFFGKLAEGFEDLKEAGFGISFASIALAAIIVAVGILFPFIFNTYIMPIQEIIIQ